MDHNLINKVITNSVTDEGLVDYLEDMCDDVTNCFGKCLMVSEGFVEFIPDSVKESSSQFCLRAVHSIDRVDFRKKSYLGCPFFKNGKKMLIALRRENKK